MKRAPDSSGDRPPKRPGSSNTFLIDSTYANIEGGNSDSGAGQPQSSSANQLSSAVAPQNYQGQEGPQLHATSAPAPPGSEVAVAQPPFAAAIAAAGGQRIPAYLLPHRKPKNFADRLMRVLLNGVAPDTLWWVGNGKAVAMSAANLKRGTLLQTHFKTKDYNAFIRICNRWGFSRTNKYAVPEGVKVYECSLFQRDAPHLMLHMRMDSDVQDVYLQDEQGRNSNKNRRQQRKSSPAALAAIRGMAAMPPAAIPQPINQNPLPQQSQQVPQQQQQPPPPPLDLQSLLNLVHHAGGGNVAPSSAAPSSPGAMTSSSGYSAQYEAAPHSGMNTGVPMGSSVPLQDTLLQQILDLSQEYLSKTSEPQAQTSDATAPIRTTMQLILTLGQQYLEERKQAREQQQQELSGSAVTTNNAQHLLAELLKSVLQQQPQSAGDVSGASSISGSQHQARMGTQSFGQSVAVAAAPADTQHEAKSDTSDPNPTAVLNALETFLRGTLGTQGSTQTTPPPPAMQGAAFASVNSSHASAPQGNVSATSQQQQEDMQQRLMAFLNQNSQPRSS